MISTYGLYWYHRRFGSFFEKEYEGFQAREKYTQQEWDDYCARRLADLLNHARANVPYYAKLFRECGLASQIITPDVAFETLQKLPFLEKDTLRLFGMNDLLSKKKEKGRRFYSSSGSTGTPTKISYSLRTQQSYAAAHEARCRNWASLSKGDPRGMIGGRRIIPAANSRGPYYRYNLVEKQVYFSAYHISKQTISNYIEGMKKHRVSYMTGYAVSNYLLARLIEEEGLVAPKLKAVVTSSEKLTQNMRKTFERVYGCKTYDGYSGVEASCMITECEYGKLHISNDVGWIEILDFQGKKCRPGEEGEVVCTGLLNYDQPLIRYRIGDRVILSTDQDCKCGRNMPVIEEIVGRVEDVLEGPDGRKMVRFHGIFVDILGLKQTQLVQLTKNDYRIKCVVDESYKNVSEVIMKKRMVSQLGDVNVEFEYLDSIPLSSNGKYKSVVSELRE